MLASTRRLIHETLHLTEESTLGVLTPEEKCRYRKGSCDVELRFVSFMDERGLQYAQRVRICTLDLFTPETLLPHLRYFQSLNQVHTLIIDHCCPTEWMSYHATCFTHSYPTLTDTVAPDLSPPLRGHLRLVGYNPFVQLWADLFREPIQLSINRNRELSWESSPACAERMCTNPRKPRHRGLYIRYSLAPVPPLGYRWTIFDISTVSIKPQYLTFEKMAVPRRLTYCMMFHQLFIIPGCNNLLLGTLSTIASPIFHEFVLELGGPASLPEGWSQESRGLWRNVDNIFAEEFVRHGGFRLIVSTSDLSHWEDLRGRARWGF